MIGVRVDQRDGATIAQLQIDIDAANATSVRDELASSMPHDASDLIVDLSDSHYLDSAGIDMLFQLNARLRQRRRSLRVVIPADSQLARLAEIVAMPSAIPVHPTIDDAFGATRVDAHTLRRLQGLQAHASD